MESSTEDDAPDIFHREDSEGASEGESLEDAEENTKGEDSSGVIKVGQNMVKGGQNMMKGASKIAKSAAQGASNVAKATKELTDEKTKEVAKVLSKVVPKRESNKIEKEVSEEAEEEQSSLSTTTTSEKAAASKVSVDVSLSEKEIQSTESTIKTSSTPATSANERRNHSLPSIAIKAIEASRTDGAMDDHIIFWVVVVSIVILQLFENVSKIMANEFPVSVVCSFMLLGFSIGLEIDEKTLMREIKTNLFGIQDGDSKTTTITTTTRQIDTFALRSRRADETKSQMYNPFARFLRRGQDSMRRRRPSAKTALQKDSNRQDGEKKIIDVNLLKRLQRFRSRTRKSKMAELVEEESPSMDTFAIDKSTSKKESNHRMGSADINAVHAETLLEKMDVEPLFGLRGLDIFLADLSEPEMSNHPFLIKNGLRKVPTFLLNVMTQWGNLLVYFEMPAWVENLTESLVESEDDSTSVKALKRFLNGSDEYRKARLKIMPEIIEAAYAVRLMAPKGKEIQIDYPDFLPTTYRVHDVAGKQCPIMEVTLDLMCNSTMRGMASLVKRYLSTLSVDSALVISTPDDQEEKEPEACLGLFGMDHLDISTYPNLPDRFETEGCSMVTVDSIRANLLAKSGAHFHASTRRSIAMTAT